MRFLHTSDLHLGISLCENSLLPYQQKLPELICRAALDSGADVVLLAGDIYDNVLTGAEAIAVYNRIMAKLCLEHGKTAVLCAGNHDGAARLSACSELLREAGLHIYGRVQFPARPLELGGCDLYVLPYFNTDEIRAAFPDASIKSYADAMETILSSIRESWNPTRRNILMAHCFVTGGELSESDTAARIGGASAVPAAAFHGFDYVALGHLHKPQTLGKNVRYSGTPLKYSFSEAGHTKSFTLFDSDDGTFAEIPIPQPLELKILQDGYEALLEAGEPDGPDTFYKIIMTDRFAGQETYSRLKERYPGLLQLQGRAVEADGALPLTLEEVQGLSPIELVRRFYSDQTGAGIEEEQLRWFEAALESGEKEERQ